MNIPVGFADFSFPNNFLFKYTQFSIQSVSKLHVIATPKKYILFSLFLPLSHSSINFDTTSYQLFQFFHVKRVKNGRPCPNIFPIPYIHKLNNAY